MVKRLQGSNALIDNEKQGQAKIKRVRESHGEKRRYKKRQIKKTRREK